jgi:lysophospholipase L1-like esterase
MFFGDSNTHGTAPIAVQGSLDRLPEAERWTSVAAKALGDGWNVIAEGHPGRTTVHPDPVEGGHKSGILALPMLLESHRPLDAVVVMLGTNDLKQRFAASPTVIAQGVERLVECIAASNAGPEGGAPRCLVVAPVPVIETGMFVDIFTGGAEKSRRLAPALSEMAGRRGAPFLDAGAVAEADSVDGIHLDAAAHAAVGRAVATKLAEMFNGR